MCADNILGIARTGTVQRLEKLPVLRISGVGGVAVNDVMNDGV